MLKISKAQIQEFNKNGFISLDNFFQKMILIIQKKNLKNYFMDFTLIK